MPMAPDRLYYLLMEERDPTVPDAQLYAAVRKGRRWLMQGEAMTALEYSDRAGVSTSAFHFALDTLRLAGFELVGETEVIVRPSGTKAQTKRYRIANLDHVPQPDEVDAAQAKDRAAKRRADARRAKAKAESTDVERVEPEPDRNPIKATNTNGHQLPDGLPALDETMVVYALARNDDGSLTVGLRNGSRRFLTTLAGMVE
jgi:hypothetical protein